MTRIVGLESEMKHISRHGANTGNVISLWTAWVACSPEIKGVISFVCAGFR
jgi:hypothetical protein